MNNKYYVYIHYRKTDNTPFYVGKGEGSRMNRKSRRNQYWKNVVNKNGYYGEKIEEGLSEKEALYWETYWIWQLKNWNYKLTNFVYEDKIRIYTPEAIKNMSDAHIGQIPWNKGKIKYILKIHNKPAIWKSCKRCDNGFLSRKDKNTKFCSNNCCNKYNK